MCRWAGDLRHGLLVWHLIWSMRGGFTKKRIDNDSAGTWHDPVLAAKMQKTATVKITACRNVRCHRQETREALDFDSVADRIHDRSCVCVCLCRSRETSSRGSGEVNAKPFLSAPKMEHGKPCDWETAISVVD